MSSDTPSVVMILPTKGSSPGGVCRYSVPLVASMMYSALIRVPTGRSGRARHAGHHDVVDRHVVGLGGVEQEAPWRPG